MDALKRPLSLVLGLMALVVLLHFVFTPFYEQLVDALSIWHVLNWVMAVGIILTLIVTCIRRRMVASDANAPPDYFCVTVAFYAAVVLAVLFFWNWFDDLHAGEEGQSQTRRNYWVIINTLFVVLLGSISAHLWRRTS